MIIAQHLTSSPRKRSFACLFSSPSDARTSQLETVEVSVEPGLVLGACPNVQPVDHPHLDVVIESKVGFASEASDQKLIWL